MKKLIVLILAVVTLSLLFIVGIAAETTDVTGNVQFTYVIDDEFNHLGILHEDAVLVHWDDPSCKELALALSTTLKSDYGGTNKGGGIRKINYTILGETKNSEYDMVWIGSTKKETNPYDPSVDGNNAGLQYTINITTPGKYELIFVGTATRDNGQNRGFCYRVDDGEKCAVVCNDMGSGAYSYSYDYKDTVAFQTSYYMVGYAHNIVVDLTAGEHTITYYNLEENYTSSRLNYFGFYYQRYVDESSTYLGSGMIGEGIKWYVNANGTLIIDGTAGGYTVNNTFEGDEKCAIPDYATGNEAPWAYLKDKIKSIFVRDKVVSVGKNAFSALTNVEVAVAGRNITSIGASAFEGLSKMTCCYFSGNVKSIGENAFNGCAGLAEFDLGDKLETLGAGALANCTGIKEIFSGNSLAVIPEGAFAGCTSVTKIKLGKNVTTISADAFKGCTAVKNLTISGNQIAEIAESAVADFGTLENLTVLNMERAKWEAVTGSAGIKYELAAFEDQDVDANDTAPGDDVTTEDDNKVSEKPGDDTKPDDGATTTAKPADNTTAPKPDDDSAKKGCGGFAGIAAVIALFVSSVAVIIVKKK